MADVKTFIESLLAKCELDKVKFDFKCPCCAYITKNKDCLIFMYVKDDIDLIEEIFKEQHLLIDEIQSFESFDTGMDRNTALIIMTEECADETIIQNIELDTNYFRKSIICYNIDLLNFFACPDVYSNMRDFLNDRNNFENYKNRHSNEYAFASSLFINIPFLDLPIVEKSVEKLEDQINLKLAELNLVIDRDTFLTLNEDSLSSNKLYAFIKKEFNNA